MIEFKQILGRGTRINEKHDKLYFNLLDFRDVSNKFADPDFDGDPIPVDGGEDEGGKGGVGGKGEELKTAVVTLGMTVMVANQEERFM